MRRRRTKQQRQEDPALGGQSRGATSRSQQQPPAPTASLFLAADGGLRFPTIVFLSAFPLAWTGRWVWAAVAILLCLLAALCNAMDDIQQQDKLEIRFNILEPKDVLRELKQWEENMKENDDSDATQQNGEAIVQKGIEALAKKYGLESAKLRSAAELQVAATQQRQSRQNQQQQFGRDPRLRELALLCQEAAYVGFRCFPENDSIVAASLSLAALVAKQDAVRERHLEQADKYGLDQPIQCMREALDRAKDVVVDDDDDDDVAPDESLTSSPATTPPSSDNTLRLSREQLAAELQRKGCLLLGALADGDADMARLVTQEAGVEVILQAVDWYRFHSDVANWGLWAVFILSNEDPANKAAVVQFNGVPIVIRAIRNCSDTLEVARHGVAVLFELLREQDAATTTAGRITQAPRLDVWRIRNSALAEGIHEVIVGVMEEYSDSMEIIMMGSAILSGTDYKGAIPQFQPVK